VKLRIGTRRSRLALVQADLVALALAQNGVGAELVPMVTSGDRGVPAEAGPAGLKGLFVAEIVRALQDGEVDLAVHSAKDLPSEDPEGLVIAAVPERADPHDVLVTRDGAIGPGAVVGTSSPRRRAQLLRARPELEVRDLRGNVDTRLRKLDEGEVDAVVLAAAGLARLEIEPPHAERLPLEVMVPAPGQGALAVQSRETDTATRKALQALDHEPSRTALVAERELMDALGGGCALPLGALATLENGRVLMIAVVADPDGSRLVRAEVAADSASSAAAEAADDLLSQGAGEILSELRPES